MKVDILYLEFKPPALTCLLLALFSSDKQIHEF